MLCSAGEAAMLHCAGGDCHPPLSRGGETDMLGSEGHTSMRGSERKTALLYSAGETAMVHSVGETGILGSHREDCQALLCRGD